MVTLMRNRGNENTSSHFIFVVVVVVVCNLESVGFYYFINFE
jgi:hypothetical protein